MMTALQKELTSTNDLHVLYMYIAAWWHRLIEKAETWLIADAYQNYDKAWVLRKGSN